MPVEYLKESPSQTAGPYVHIGTLPAVAGLAQREAERLDVLFPDAPAAARIRIEGVVWDGAGAPVRDAMIELWQADAEGRPVGWGRAASDFETGLWSFDTVRPGVLAWEDGRPQAPHATLLIFARGINIHLHTRIYFPEDKEAHAVDPVLRRVGEEGLRATLVAARQPGAGVPTYRFDVRLQGDQETVFFDS